MIFPLFVPLQICLNSRKLQGSNFSQSSFWGVFLAGDESWDASCVFVRSRAESSAQAKGHLLKEVWAKNHQTPGVDPQKTVVCFLIRKKAHGVLLCLFWLLSG